MKTNIYVKKGNKRAFNQEQMLNFAVMLNLY